MRNIKKTLFGFFKKELTQALRDPKMRFLIIVTPIVQMTVFGLALSSDVKNVILSAHAEMNDPLMTDVIRNAIGSGWFIKGDETTSQSENGYDEISSGKAEVALFAPEGGLTQSWGRNDGHIQALIDSADLVRSRSIDNYIQAIVKRTAEEFSGQPEPTPLFFSTRLLYNPEMVSAYYLVPGVICMLICIITITLTSMAIAKEKEVGTFETLISAPVTSIEILLGKTVPYLIIGSINLPLIMIIAIVGFKVPMRGSFIELTIATFFFLITTVSIGTLISTIAKNQQQAMMGGFLFIMPAILLSGIMFPVENMPYALRIISKFNPLMYFITLLRNIMLKGGDPVVLWKNTGALVLISFFSATYAVKRFHLNLGD